MGSGAHTPLGCISEVLVLLFPVTLAVDIESQTFGIRKIFCLLRSLALANLESPGFQNVASVMSSENPFRDPTESFVLVYVHILTKGRQCEEQSLHLSGRQELVTPRFDAGNLIYCKYYCMLFM